MKINYPIKKEKSEHYVNSASRGMNLEEDLNFTNEFYLNNNIAVIYKKPTPIQVVDVYYPSRNQAVITKAYYKTPSTTDYNGLYKGKYIDFEAKETISKTSFPLRNIHEHQINHLRKIIEHDGVAFFIISFKHYGTCFLVWAIDVIKFWDLQEQDRKSIPYSFFLENAHLIKQGAFPRLDYLKILDETIFKSL